MFAAYAAWSAREIELQALATLAAFAQISTPSAAHFLKSHQLLGWRRIEICKKRPRLLFERLCASRSGEVLGARWSEINIGQKTWTIPAARMKADKDHAVPLAPAAIEILAGQSHDSEFVFAAPRSGRAMERHALADVMKAMACRETLGARRLAFACWDNSEINKGIFST